MSRNLRHLFAITGLSLAMGLSGGFAIGDEKQTHEAASEKRKYYVEDIKSTMKKHIEESVDEKGIFRIKDEKTEEILEVKFVQIHDPVRQIGTDIYFACTDFHVVGEPDKLYDLDFWMNDKTGELKIFQSKVHKEPRWSLLYGWYKQPRYTFVNDEIEYLY